MKTFSAKPHEVTRGWYLIDATDKVLGRLAVSEAQLRRVFFEKQLNDTKEHLIKAEQELRQLALGPQR
jgi:ribosomal protein L13